MSLHFLTVFSVQNRPSSRRKEDWEIPQSTNATYGGQGIPHCLHGNRMTGLKWRLFVCSWEVDSFWNWERWKENIYVTELLRAEGPACTLRLALEWECHCLQLQNLYFWKLNKYPRNFCRSFDVGQIYNYFSGKFISVICWINKKS